MNATTLSPIATRFAWKEYRTLRGFWLAALIIAALVQSSALLFQSGASNTHWADLFFGIALAAAALYAVGVAATTFSMEHEEETYAYLTSLPTRWLPLFAGKLSFAFTSGVALALALALCGWVLSGWNLPSRGVTLATLGVFGFAIVELIAWGTLFSLIVRQPLLAALLAIGTESLALTIAVNTYADRTLPALTLSSYFQVLPTRLTIAACVFAIDILLARRWLTLDAPRATGKFPAASLKFPTAMRRLVAHRAISPIAGPSHLSGLRVLIHLLWQTWRGSWGLMLAAATVALLLCCAPYLITNDVRFRIPDLRMAIALVAIGLVVATLYASLVFATDQRGRSYRFLAEHAAWPRYVWFARLVVWLVPALIVWGVAAGLFKLITDSQFQRMHGQAIDDFKAVLEFAIWGLLLGIAVGQACSLFFRRAIVAGFAATVISLPLLVWGFAIWSWELPPLQFLLPLVIGLFAATWLRIPDWIVDRNSLRAWLKVAVVVVIPITLVGWLLIRSRELPPKNDQIALAQIGNAMGITPSFHSSTAPFDLSAVIDKWIARHKSAATNADRAAGDRLIRLSEMIEMPQLRTRTATDPDRTQADWDDYNRRFLELNRKIVDEAAALSGKKYVFPPMFVLDRRSDRIYDRLTTLVELLGNAGVAATQDGNLDDALKYHIEALRLCDHLSDATSAGTTLSSWPRLMLQSKLVDWAAAKGQTSHRIRAAIAALDAIYPPLTTFPASNQFQLNEASLSGSTPPAPLMIEYLSIRDILLGKQPSNLLMTNASFVDYLPVMANELPFERARALKLLDYLLVARAAQWYDVISNINQDYLQHLARDNDAQGEAANTVFVAKTIRGQIQLAYESSFEHSQLIDRERDYPPYSWLRTTYLLRHELERPSSFGQWLASIVDAQVAGWGLRQQLALVAYRLDHDAYPEELSDLAPDYLPFVPIDPYSGRAFEYRPEGLPLQLELYSGQVTRIEPDTPFLWSVGPGDEHLEIRMTRDAVDPMADPSQDAVDVRHEIYVLQSNSSSWRLSRPLVFPLPK